MNLFHSKLRRTATVVGGSIVGLGIVAAMAGPALACSSVIDKPTTECATDNSGNWNVDWSVSSDVNRATRSEAISDIELDGNSVQSVGDIKVGTTVTKGNWLKGTSTESGSTQQATLRIKFGNYGWGKVKKADKPETGCKVVTTTPPTTPPTTTDTTPPTTTPTDTPTVPIPTPSTTSSTEPVLPNEIFAEDCTSITIGLDNTKGEIEYKLHFVPSTGSAKDLDIKAGEKKSATFDATTGFTVKVTIVAVFNGESSEAETVTVPYEKPSSCGSGDLAVTGSSAAPLAGGAVAVAGIGAGLFFMARRRKLKFTA